MVCELVCCGLAFEVVGGFDVVAVYLRLVLPGFGVDCIFFVELWYSICGWFVLGAVLLLFDVIVVVGWVWFSGWWFWFVCVCLWWMVLFVLLMVGSLLFWWFGGGLSLA